jgi:hypothetical protein
MGNPHEHFTDEEIARRRDNAIRRALNTPPKPLKEIVGKSKRAIAQRKSRIKKSCLVYDRVGVPPLECSFRTP